MRMLMIWAVLMPLAAPQAEWPEERPVDPETEVSSESIRPDENLPDESCSEPEDAMPEEPEEDERGWFRA